MSKIRFSVQLSDLRRAAKLFDLDCVGNKRMQESEGVLTDIIYLSVRIISRKDDGGSGDDSERASGRDSGHLGPRAQLVPTPRRDRFVMLSRENERERVCVSTCISLSRRVECTVTSASCNFSRVTSFPVIPRDF